MIEVFYMKLNNKGLATSFILLIFLLIILGVYYFMKPYFDKAMEASRKKSFISDARAYVSGARNMWTQGDLECQESGDKSNLLERLAGQRKVNEILREGGCARCRHRPACRAAQPQGNLLQVSQRLLNRRTP